MVPLFIDANCFFLVLAVWRFTFITKAEVEASKVFGGFPVSGQWLGWKKPEFGWQHFAKVYGSAPIGAPYVCSAFRYTLIAGKKAIYLGLCWIHRLSF